jgi:hypothetical protein
MGELGISDDVSIIGPGAELVTIDAQSQSRIFNIDDPALPFLQYFRINVEISDLKLTGASVYAINSRAVLTVDRCMISGNTGGGVYSRYGQLNLLNSTFTNNYSGGIASRYGKVTISGSTFRDNSINGGGGAIYNYAGDLTIADSLISGNTASNSGGGILIVRGELNLSNVTITGNSAQYGRGGGIYAKSPNVTVKNSRITGNYSNEYGGGIYLTGRGSFTATLLSDNVTNGLGGGIFGGEPLSLIDCAITGNQANRGGGVFTSGADLLLIGSELRANYATNNGGGISFSGDTITIKASGVTGNFASGSGGGIYVSGAAAKIVNSTISGNTSGMHGAGLYGTQNFFAEQPTFTVEHSTIANNSAVGLGGGLFTTGGAISLNHAIVASNSASLGMDFTALLGTVVGANYSLIGNGQGTGLAESPVGFPDTNGNLVGGPVHGIIDPLLGPLADNGGPTLTRALLPNSPAINSGDLEAMAGQGGVPLHDQRGLPFTRISGGRIDIGAFEVQPTPIDFNYDGFVDVADYVMWRKVLTTTFEEGYGIWTTHFGESVGGGAIGEADEVLGDSPSAALAEPVASEKSAVLRQSGAAALALAAPVPDSNVRTIKAGSGSVSHAKTFRELRVRDAALIAWLGQRVEVRGGNAFDSESVTSDDADDEVVGFAFDSLDGQIDLQSHDEWNL